MLRLAILAASVLPQLVLGQLVPREWEGQKYGCRCYADDECWPKAPAWKKLNSTVEGNLAVHVPPEAACHNTFDGPLGSIETYNAAACEVCPSCRCTCLEGINANTIGRTSKRTFWTSSGST